MRHTLKANARRSVERFERSKIDALEAAYYQKVFDLQAAGAFAIPLGKRIRRSVGRRARRVLPKPAKERLKSLIGPS